MSREWGGRGREDDWDSAGQSTGTLDTQPNIWDTGGKGAGGVGGSELLGGVGLFGEALSRLTEMILCGF